MHACVRENKVTHTVFVDLLNDVLEGGGFDFESHEGEDVSDVLCGDGAFLVGKPVEAAFQHIHLLRVQTHVLLQKKKWNTIKTQDCVEIQGAKESGLGVI